MYCMKILQISLSQSASPNSLYADRLSPATIESLSSNSTPRLSRKNSQSSKSGRHRKCSEDKVSLLDASHANSDGDGDCDDVFTTNKQGDSNSNWSRNNSIKDVDLLQVPQRRQLNSSSSESSLCSVTFEMDRATKRNQQSPSNRSLSPLSLYIPAPHLIPQAPAVNNSCNGSSNHSPHSKMNGSCTKTGAGEQTPLLTTLAQENKASENRVNKQWQTNHLFKNHVNNDDGDIHRSKLSFRSSSVYSKLNGNYTCMS